jgi:ribonuclease Z
MVFNVTKDDIRVRMSAVDEEVWPSPPLKAKIAPDTGSAIAFSEFTISGALGFPEVVGPIYDDVNELYGTDYELLFKEERCAEGSLKRRRTSAVRTEPTCRTKQP